MLEIFQVCFFAGFGLILISFIFGGIFDTLGFDGLDLDLDLLGINIFLPINLTLCTLFITVYGGIGWILMGSFPSLFMVFVVIISILSGIAISGCVHFFIMKPLKKAENTSSPKLEELVGIIGTVSERIRVDGFGEIRYVVNGNSFTAPAKSTDGTELKVGTEIIIGWIEDHVFYVFVMPDM